MFVRVGHLAGGAADVLALKGGAATARVLSGAKMAGRVISTVDPDYANGTALPQVADGILSTLSAFQSALSSLPSDFKTRAQNTLLAMYAVDRLGASSVGPLSQLTSGATLQAAAAELIRQMVASGDSVNQATVSAGAQTAQGSPTGNPVVVVSLLNGQGKTLQTPFAETLTFKCSSDSQSGGATAGSEPVSVTGQAAVSDVLSDLFPGGSGTSASLTAVDGSRSNAGGNKLTNSDFFTYTTANYPDNWVALVGAAGTDIFNGTADGPYTTSGGALKLTGTGAALLTSVAQPFNTAASTGAGVGGTPATLLPNTVYHFSLWYKVSATPAAGALQVGLVDSTNTAINDDAGTANTVTQVLTAATSSYANLTGSFRTPSVLPSAVKLRVRLSTAIDSGKSAYVGRLSLTQATQLYTGGPYASVHSGATRMIAGLSPDTWTLAVSATRGVLQDWADRFWGLRALGLQLPYSGSPTLADSLVA